MIFKKSNTILIRVGLLLLLMTAMGCAAHTAASHWKRDLLSMDGSEAEWPAVPQYYNAERQVGIRVMNDADAVYFCLVTSDEKLKKKILMTGLTVWIDPAGEQHKTFGLHLPGVGPRELAGKLKDGDHQAKSKARPVLKTPKSIAITYAEATGPLAMPMAQVRQTGIDVGAGQPDGRRCVYEFKIGFKAGPSLSTLGSGQTVGIGIEIGKQDKGQQRQGRSDSGMGRAKRGGGGGGGGGMGSKGRSHGNAFPGAGSKLFETWLKISLAEGGIPG